MTLTKIQRAAITGLIVFAATAVVVLCVVAGLGYFSPPDDDSKTTPVQPVTGCDVCQVSTAADWMTYAGGGYVAEKCDTELYVSIDSANNIFRIGGDKPDSLENGQALKTETVNLLQSDLTFGWVVSETSRSNETVTVVFTDNGDTYGGLGKFDKEVTKSKPGEDSTTKYTLYTTVANPWYLPFYISSGQNGAACVVADTKGLPMEVTVKHTATEWVIFSTEEVSFFLFEGASRRGVMTECWDKLKTLYSVPHATAENPAWSNDFILGSFATTQDITDSISNQQDNLVTHYILSGDNLSVENGQLVVQDSDSFSFSNVLLELPALMSVTADPLPTPADGYLAVGDKFILDYGNSDVTTLVSDGISTTSPHKVLFTEGTLLYTQGPPCDQLFYCDSLTHPADQCLSAKFDDSSSPLLQLHNTYDASRLSAAPNSIQSVVTPATTRYFHDPVSGFTSAGLTECLNTILNLQDAGVRAVMCNMCAGHTPQSGDSDQQNLCQRWSHLSLLMPSVIMRGDTPPAETDSFDIIKPALTLRRQLSYFLRDAYHDTQSTGNAFVYSYNAAEGVTLAPGSHTVKFGTSDDLVMVFPAEGSQQVVLPRGNWMSVTSPADSTLIYSGGSTSITLSRSVLDVANVLFYRVTSIFVMLDTDTENQVTVRIFQSTDDDLREGTITTNFEYAEPGSGTFQTTISLDPIDSKISFTPAVSNGVLTEIISVSKVELYGWHESPTNTDPGVTVNEIDNNGSPYYNIEFDLSGGLKELFTNFELKISASSGS